jgi:hypothetical protein
VEIGLRSDIVITSLAVGAAHVRCDDRHSRQARKSQ